MTFKRKVLAALTRSELLEVGRALELEASLRSTECLATLSEIDLTIVPL